LQKRRSAFALGDDGSAVLMLAALIAKYDFVAKSSAVCRLYRKEHCRSCTPSQNRRRFSSLNYRRARRQCSFPVETTKPAETRDKIILPAMSAANINTAAPVVAQRKRVRRFCKTSNFLAASDCRLDQP